VIRVTRALAMAGAKIGKFNLANGNEMVRIKDGLGNRLAIRVAEFKRESPRPAPPWLCRAWCLARFSD
jgi:hypothetical protein